MSNDFNKWLCNLSREEVELEQESVERLVEDDLVNAKDFVTNRKNVEKWVTESQLGLDAEDKDEH